MFNIKVNCPYCEESFVHEFESLDCDCSDEDRPMGPEMCHSGENSLICPGCSKSFEAKVEIYEYPEGVRNHCNIEYIYDEDWEEEEAEYEEEEEDEAD